MMLSFAEGEFVQEFKGDLDREPDYLDQFRCCSSFAGRLTANSAVSSINSSVSISAPTLSS